MHPWILGGGLLLAGAGALPALAAAGGRCPALNAALVERFIAADCSACWAADTAPAAAAAPARGWTLDWLLPRGSEAPMSAAALPEAAERAQRAGLPAVVDGAARPAQESPVSRPALPRRPGLTMTVGSGPAWQGYFGLQLRLAVGVTTRLPSGTTAWLALVETIPAGSEGSAVPRQLVRSVAGPLPLDAMRPGRPFSHLQALRWPEGAQPTRLQARGWLEAPDGRVLAMAADRCP